MTGDGGSVECHAYMYVVQNARHFWVAVQGSVVPLSIEVIAHEPADTGPGDDVTREVPAGADS